MFRSQVLVEVGNDVTLHGDGAHGIGEARRRHGIDAGGVVDKIGCEGAVFDLGFGESFGELIENGRYHLQMRQFFRSDIGEDSHHVAIRHGIALVQIPHGSV